MMAIETGKVKKGRHGLFAELVFGLEERSKTLNHSERANVIRLSIVRECIIPRFACLPQAVKLGFLLPKPSDIALGDDPHHRLQYASADSHELRES